ncbi:MAG: GNAT family N-acetyltransferase [Lachnospiraceae bacterium]|nr:GNAT family N-acetyltransferase [Lachnospiraceae bacterium]MBO4632785.1 GNAT family N-acetyltransferase [Lentisphaeria bacterium]
MIYRIFQEKDWKALHKLYNRIFTADRVTENFFLEHLILSPNFDPDGIILAEENGQLTGAVIAQVVSRNLSPWTDQVSVAGTTGYLMPPLISDPDTGKHLIAEAEKYFLAQSRTNIRGSAIGPTLFPDSVDSSNYPVICQVFEESGYQISGHYFSMGRSLLNYQPDEKIMEKIQILRKKGIVAKVCESEDVPAVRRFMQNGDLIGRIQNLSQKISRNELDQVVIIRNEDRVLGYCQYNYYGEQERVGPFGVAKEMRGQGIGQVMVAKLLEVMSLRSFLYVWFASCSETNTNFYRKNGFEIFRTKNVYVKTLKGIAR